MENFYLEGTVKTPMIHFEYDTGNLTLSGRSIPENSIDFYKGAMEWLDEYVKVPQEDTEFTVRLEYFNTSSSKCLVEIFRKLEGIYNDGKIVNIMWFYESEDEDMMESGQDFGQILKIPVKLIEEKTEE